MTHDLSDFEQQLGRELEAAARRRIETRQTSPLAGRTRRVGLAVAAAAAVAVALAVFAFVRPEPAAADLFMVIYLEEETHLEIVGLVKDPSAGERELQNEFGIDVEFVALPAPPELIGQVVGAASSGTTTAQVVFDDAGRAQRVVLPREIDGTLTVQYGRQGEPGERYHVTVTSPLCSELWAQTPEQAEARLTALATRVRYDTFDSEYVYASHVALTDVDAGYRLIDTTYLSQHELLVVYSSHLDALGVERPNCGWSGASSG